MFMVLFIGLLLYFVYIVRCGFLGGVECVFVLVFVCILIFNCKFLVVFVGINRVSLYLCKLKYLIRLIVSFNCFLLFFLS